MATTTSSRLATKKTSRRPKQPQRSEIHSYLVIRAPELDPRAVTKIMKLEPTRTWRRGDLVHPPATHRHKDDGWELKSTYASGHQLTKYVEALINQVRPTASLFTDLPRGATVYVLCAIYEYEYRQTQLSLSKEAVAGLALVGAEFYIDYYDLSKHAD